MLFIQIALVIIVIFLLINIFVSLRTLKTNTQNEINYSLQTLTQNLKDIENNLKNEFSTNRKENTDNSRDLRIEIVKQLDTFTKTFSDQLAALNKTIDSRLSDYQTTIERNSRENRSELATNLESFKKELNTALQDFKERLKENFDAFDKSQKTQNIATGEKLEGIKRTLESSIKNLQDGNEKKLEEMRNTVDEKLQKTLESRLTQSFNQVSQSLESVQKGLGEMQQLATGVGDLKKVLSNVKSRGILGEIQLGAILEQILSPEQYQKNVKTKQNSKENVEYAVCLPGGDDGSVCYLPIDSKFPVEDYYALVNAFETGDITAVEILRKSLENVIKKCSKDIRDKYLDPPNTTDFGVMFLPFEGLYAEVVRNTSLIETLQRDFRIIVTGPSTLAALLSSLRLGFKTLAIEKRSGEIKRTLQAVKTEFNRFGDVLQKAQDKISGASSDIDKLVGTRTRKIQSKLRSLEELPGLEAKALIEPNNDDDNADDNDEEDN